MDAIFFLFYFSSRISQLSECTKPTRFVLIGIFFGIYKIRGKVFYFYEGRWEDERGAWNTTLGGIFQDQFNGFCLLNWRKQVKSGVMEYWLLEFLFGKKPLDWCLKILSNEVSQDRTFHVKFFSLLSPYGMIAPFIFTRLGVCTIIYNSREIAIIICTYKLGTWKWRRGFATQFWN